MSSIFETRRRNLITYIEDKHQGNRAEFCRAIGKNPNLINLALTKNPEYRKNIGEKLARDIERLANMPNGWLDFCETQPAEPTWTVSIRTGDKEVDGKLWLTINKEFAKVLKAQGNTTMLLVIEPNDKDCFNVSGHRVNLPSVGTIPSL